MHNFFYDETEHSRKINFQTISAKNYYDNFISVIVGWSSEDDSIITDRYLEFEKKYEDRKQNGELKSQTMKSKDFNLGFASFNKNKINFYEDLISLYDEKVIIYVCVSSKIEYVINQILSNYHNSILWDMDYMKYSVIKAINVYHPQKVIEAIYREPQIFVDELKNFLYKQIETNQANVSLKSQENKAFSEVIMALENAETPKNLDWSYNLPFEGFKKYLVEMNIDEYELVLDREGEKSITLKSAKFVGLKNVNEGDSKEYIGIRMADMLAGLISKMMQSLEKNLHSDCKDGEINKVLLESGWFMLNSRQLGLYKKMHKILCDNYNSWNKVYTGIYSDDLVAFISLIQFMNNFESDDEIRTYKIEMLPEYYNSFTCDRLQERYMILGNKLSLESIADDDKDFFYNQKGAKVYKEIKKQPMLPLHEGDNKYLVLSAGFFQDGTPLVTISDNGKPECYRIPMDYSEWTKNVVAFANKGMNFFPEEVVFSVEDGKYYVDIL